MRARLLPAICLLAVLVISTQALPKESVRQELVRLQSQNGLTLAAFYRSIYIVLFDGRSMLEGVELLPLGTAGEGAFTRDGTKLSLVLNHWQQGSRPYGTLGVVRHDGTGLQDYSDYGSSSEMCWSYDDTEVATGDLRIITLGKNSNRVESAALPPDSRPSVSTQCWSPDGQHIVYGLEIGGHTTDKGPYARGALSVWIYDIREGRSRELVEGSDPSWSPDGDWIAFRDGDNYYEIHPSGEGRKFLFHKKATRSGLLWSTDSRIVAYMSHCEGFEGPWGFWDVGWVRLRVRRLSDNSEDWVAEVADSFQPRWQWVTNPELIKQVKSSPLR
jgi:WD40-like Beta Propeller Repeat